MEEMMMTHKQGCRRIPAALGLHRESQTISKDIKAPKIRIIHIFAPEIIKTDVANFRELVQRLTGKPSENGCCKKKTKKPRTHATTIHSCREEEPTRSSTTTSTPIFMAADMKMDHQLMRISGISDQRLIKEEENDEGMWNAEKSGGFLERFADLEGCFIQEFGAEFPFLPPNLDANSNCHHLHGFEAPLINLSN